MENLFYRDKKFTLEYRDSGPRYLSHSLCRQLSVLFLYKFCHSFDVNSHTRTHTFN